MTSTTSRGIDGLLGASTRLLLLAPHPDDETLAAGGLVQRARAAGVTVTVVFATDGDNTPWTQRVVERRYRIGLRDRLRFGRRRRAEAERAMAVLGVDRERLHFLGLPDQGLTRTLLEGQSATLDTLVGILRLEQPDVVVLPSLADMHQDHGALAVLARMALHQARLERAPRLLAYGVHGEARHALHPAMVLVLTPEERVRKRSALLAHVTQLAVHPRSLFAFQPDAEAFALEHEDHVDAAAASERPSAASPEGRHPLAADLAPDGSLRIEAGPGPWWRATGRGGLLLVASSPEGVLTARIDMHRGGRASVLDPCTGHSLALATWSRRDRAREIRVTGLRVGAAGDLFLKRERRRGVFDDAGWLRLKQPQAAPARIVRQRPVVCAVIPCFDVSTLCGPVIAEALAHADHVLAVDDGSTDGTSAVLHGLAARSDGRLQVLSLGSNRGKGRALLEAFRYALAEVPFDVLVTLDADGQHRACDLPRLAAAIADGTEFAIGTRLDFAAMPLRSRFGNTLTCWLMRLVMPACPRDTQSGYRAFGREFVEEIVQHIPGSRYETELRILAFALSERRRCACVPIPTIYAPGNPSSHFRPLVDSVRIYRVLLGTAIPSLIAERLRGLAFGDGSRRLMQGSSPGARRSADRLDRSFA